MAWLSTRKFLRRLLGLEFSIRASTMTCASLAFLTWGSAAVSPAVAQYGSTASALHLVHRMTAAIKTCDYDEWAKAKGEYDYFVPRTRIEDLQGVPDAPSYPFPCDPVARKLRTTNFRTQQEPAKLYSVGTLARPQPVAFTGPYVGGNFSGNFFTLGQTERFKMTNAVTNDFSNSSSAMGGGFEAGYLFAPWSNGVLVGLFASVDFLNQSTNHTFAGGFFLGQDTNIIGSIGPQLGFVVAPGVMFYGQAGLAVASVDQKLNFSGPVTSANQTVTGANLGFGVAFQPANWQVAGIPVTITVGYNHFFLPATTFDNPGSPLFRYSNQDNVNQFKVGFRMPFDWRPERLPQTPYRHQF